MIAPHGDWPEVSQQGCRTSSPRARPRQLPTTAKIEECITSLKAELEEIAQAGLLFEDEASLEQHVMLDKALYVLDLNIKRLLCAYKSSPSAPEHTAGVKFLRIVVPTCNGNILHWTTFFGSNSKYPFTVKQNLAHEHGKACLSQACS